MCTVFGEWPRATDYFTSRSACQAFLQWRVSESDILLANFRKFLRTAAHSSRLVYLPQCAQTDSSFAFCGRFMHFGCGKLSLYSVANGPEAPKGCPERCGEILRFQSVDIFHLWEVPSVSLPRAVCSGQSCTENFRQEACSLL